MFLTEGRISQRIIIGDVDTCVAELTDFIVEHGFTDVVTWGSAPGLPPAVLTPSMERFAARGGAAREGGRGRFAAVAAAARRA